MDSNNIELVFAFSYKISSLISGILIVYWGYRLFINGVYKKDGEINLSFFNFNLFLKKASPGIYFTALGTFIIIYTVFKGSSYSSEYNDKRNIQPQAVRNVDSSKITLPKTLP